MGLDHMLLLEPIEESTAAEDEEMEIDGKPSGPGIESALIEADDLEVSFDEVDPAPVRSRFRGGPLPEFENEEALRSQMGADTAQALDQIPRGEEVSNRPEHANRGIERSIKAKAAHVGADESRSWPMDLRRFPPGEGEHSSGLIKAGHLVPAPGEGKVVVPRPASEVEDGPRVPSIPSEDGFQEVDVSIVVDEVVIDQIVVSGEPTIGAA